MKVKELIEILQKMPLDADIMVEHYLTESAYEVQSVYKEPWPEGETVVMISDKTEDQRHS